MDARLIGTSQRAALALLESDSVADTSECRAACRLWWVKDKCRMDWSGGSCEVAPRWCGPADRPPTRARKGGAAP
jgi:hypothetical protein